MPRAPDDAAAAVEHRVAGEVRLGATGPAHDHAALGRRCADLDGGGRRDAQHEGPLVLALAAQPQRPGAVDGRGSLGAHAGGAGGVEVVAQLAARRRRLHGHHLGLLGVRRLHENDDVIGWGVTEPVFWLTARAQPAPGYGHVAVRASGKAAVDAAWAAGVDAGGSDDGAPGPRPQYGPRYYAAYLRDPDGVTIELFQAPPGHGTGG
ncbi:MAG: VOC family protein [Actinobacteria bacterium]|nr:VOC family protein [Actinomycetota bacterium]